MHQEINGNKNLIMREIDKIRNDNYLKAKKRVKQIRGFYTHLLVYLLVNTSISIAKMILIYHVTDFKTFFGMLSHVDIYLSWLLWGIGLLIHGLVVFVFKSSIFKDWEEKKIKKYMAEGNEDLSSNQWE